MALVACSECGKEISSEAKVCPQCGAKNKNRAKTKAPRWLVVVALVGLIWWIATIYSDSLLPRLQAQCRLFHRQHAGNDR